ncbi:hypothetical protein EV126DRAFT_79214 [Verticillium dahliae]|nr:hypothetical protein EV126DRAFT_79214 [Verticillium dahliae]
MDSAADVGKRISTAFCQFKGRVFLTLALVSVSSLVVILTVLSGSVNLNETPFLERPTSVASRPPQIGALQRTGRLHFHVAASTANKQLCRAIVSSAVNRYGPPILAGWNATNKKDIGKTHLAKVRVVSEHLDNMAPDTDDDLFLLIDGYDVQLQLGPEVLIQRYFKVVAAEDERIIQQLGPALAEEVAGPLGRHVVFGADKVCWPTDQRRPGCWAIPPVPGMDDRMFGPLTESGDMAFLRPRWLNSGTIMGPVKEVRSLFRATLAHINATYRPDYEFRESDQFYMTEVWGLQELGRINAQLEKDPEAKHPSHVDDAFWPKPGPESNHHIAIDYWSNLFQTWAGYTEYVDWRTFDRPGHAFTVDQNVRAEVTFRPWDLHLAGDAMRAIHRIFASTKRSTLMGKTSDKLILESQFGSNIITKTTLPIYHCTGAKDALETFWPRMWFFPYIRTLMRSAIASCRAGEAYTPQPVDGRMWYPALPYPEDIRLDDAGAWSDGSADSGEVEWLSFETLCRPFEEDIFG